MLHHTLFTLQPKHDIMALLRGKQWASCIQSTDAEQWIQAIPPDKQMSREGENRMG